MGPTVPRERVPVWRQSDDPVKMYLNDIFTICANLTGQPAMSHPCGVDDNGQHVGMHVIGNYLTVRRACSTRRTSFNWRRIGTNGAIREAPSTAGSQTEQRSSWLTWEVVIGPGDARPAHHTVEIFSGSSTAFGASRTRRRPSLIWPRPAHCPMNRGAVERAVKFGLAIGAEDQPALDHGAQELLIRLCPRATRSAIRDAHRAGGHVVITLDDGATKTIELDACAPRKDAGKSVHDLFDRESGVDLNRAGTSLLEIVTEPVMRSAKEAIVYAKALHNLKMRYLDICDGNMQVSASVPLRCQRSRGARSGRKSLAPAARSRTRNSFKFMQQAIDYEVRWQIEDGEEDRAGHGAVQPG